MYGEKIDTEYRDELSFETAMKKFAEYMNTIGYKKMDDALKVKEFQKEDALNYPVIIVKMECISIR